MKISHQEGELFTFSGVRKHFFQDKNYRITVFSDRMEMAHTSQMNSPKYTISFTISTFIGWVVRIRQDTPQITAFQFPYREGYKEMCSDQRSLQMYQENYNSLRSMLAGKVTFQKISDFYLPEQLIGKGSSASVLQCKSLFDSERYAIKSVSKEYVFRSTTQTLPIHNEIAIMRQLDAAQSHTQHRYFLRLIELFEGETSFYIVEELMQGKTLQSQLDEHQMCSKNYDVQTRRHIMRKLLEGVELMHRNGIIHRDLKPANLMFQNPNDPSTLRIIDFGLATLQDGSAFSSIKCGTPGYMAPEILNLDPKTLYDEKIDEFSCGVIFYYMQRNNIFASLTGHNLFRGKSFQDVIIANKKCEIDFSSGELFMMVEQEEYLLKSLLLKNPNLRITATRALSLPYFSEGPQVQSALVKKQEHSPLPQKERQRGVTKQDVVLSNFNSSVKDQPITSRNPPYQVVINQRESNFESIDEVTFKNESKHHISIKQLPPLKKPSFQKVVTNPVVTYSPSPEITVKQQFTFSQRIIALDQGRKCSNLSVSNSSKVLRSIYMKNPLSLMMKKNYKLTASLSHSQEANDSNPNQSLLGLIADEVRSDEDLQLPIPEEVKDQKKFHHEKPVDLSKSAYPLAKSFKFFELD